MSGEKLFSVILPCATCNSPAGVMPCGAVALLPARMAGAASLPGCVTGGRVSAAGRGVVSAFCITRAGEGMGGSGGREKTLARAATEGGRRPCPLRRGKLRASTAEMRGFPSPRQLSTSCTGRAGPRRLPRRDARIPRRSCLRGHFREAAARVCWQVQAGAARRRMPGRCC